MKISLLVIPWTAFIGTVGGATGAILYPFIREWAIPIAFMLIIWGCWWVAGESVKAVGEEKKRDKSE